MRDKAAQVVDSDRVIVLANRDDVTAYRLSAPSTCCPDSARRESPSPAAAGPEPTTAVAVARTRDASSAATFEAVLLLIASSITR
jgi:hypothetical protein